MKCYDDNAGYVHPFQEWLKCPKCNSCAEVTRGGDEGYAQKVIWYRYEADKDKEVKNNQA